MAAPDAATGCLVSLELQAFVLLCGLAAVAFSAEPAAATGRRVLAWLAGLLLAVALLRPTASPGASGLEPTQAAMLMVLMVAACMYWQRSLLSALFAGLLTAQWLAALLVAGTPLPMALVVTLGFPACALLLSGLRPGFVSMALRDEARLIVLLAALAMTIVPAAIQGWQLQVSSQALSAGAPEEGAPWLLGLTALSLVGGLLYRFFRGWK